MNERVNICGVDFDNITMEQSLKSIEELIEKKKRATVFHPNVDCVCIAKNDRELMEIYKKSNLNLPDGMPLIWASKLLGRPLKEKISGPDLLPKVCELASRNKYSIFFLGGRDGVAKRAAEVFKNKYTGVRVAGFYHGYFDKKGNENSEVISMIRERRPDILVVAFGTPLQEKWLNDNLKELDVPLCIGAGAAIDFLSGNIPRSPEWMQKAGFEWLFRLILEPRRLWKRYLIRDMKFFYLLLCQLIGRKRRVESSK